MGEKVKKPFYKKWWIWLIVVIIVIAVAVGGNDDPKSATKDDVKSESVNDSGKDKTNQTDDSEESESDSEEASSNVEESEPDETEDKIEAGTYKIGEDIPAGEYLVFSESMAYIESASDSTGELDSIIFNDNLSKDAHSYVTLNEGEYFKLQRGVMYPVDSAPSVIPEDGVYTNGMYKVGQDIPAGEYKVILEESLLGMGYLEVSSDSRHMLSSIVTNENVQADTYITISDGQYLKLQDLRIETN